MNGFIRPRERWGGVEPDQKEKLLSFEYRTFFFLWGGFFKLFLISQQPHSTITTTTARDLLLTPSTHTCCHTD